MSGIQSPQQRPVQPGVFLPPVQPGVFPSPVQPGVFSSPVQPRVAPSGAAWLAGCLALGLAAVACTAGGIDGAFNAPGGWPGGAAQRTLWTATLWTGALVHMDTAHLLANLAALLALAGLGWLWRATPSDIVIVLLAWPLGTAALLAWPMPLSLRGLSGVLHAMAVVLALRGLRPGPAVQRALGLALGAGVLLKLLMEQAWQQPLQMAAGPGAMPVLVAAHLGSAVVAGVLVLVLALGLAMTRARVVAGTQDRTQTCTPAHTQVLDPAPAAPRSAAGADALHQ